MDHLHEYIGQFSEFIPASMSEMNTVGHKPAYISCPNVVAAVVGAVLV